MKKEEYEEKIHKLIHFFLVTGEEQLEGHVRSIHQKDKTLKL